METDGVECPCVVMVAALIVFISGCFLLRRECFSQLVRL